MKGYWGWRFKTWYLLYFLDEYTGQIQAKKKGNMKKFVVFMLVALFLLGSFPMAFAEAITDESLIQDLNTVNLKNVTTLDSERIEIPSEAIWTEVVTADYASNFIFKTNWS